MDNVKLWDKAAAGYEEYTYHDEGRYRANRFRSEMILDFFDKRKKKGKILDAGCGTGIITRELIKGGWDCVGVDFSEAMLAVARKKAAEEGIKAEFKKSSVLDMSIFPDKSFDFIIIAGVFPYISEDQEEAAYKECYRLLKKNGILIISQYNALFDLFTSDKYTVELVSEKLWSEVIEGDELEDYKKKLKTLLTKPDEPKKDRPMKTENPLIYDEKLNEYGFKEEEKCYYNFHILPPSLTTKENNALRASLENKFRESWQGLFLARTFLSIARKK